MEALQGCAFQGTIFFLMLLFFLIFFFLAIWPVLIIKEIVPNTVGKLIVGKAENISESGKTQK